MATAEERLLLRLEAQLTQFQREMNRAQGIADRSARNIERRFRSMNTNLDGIGKAAARSLLAPLATVGAALSVRQIASYADAWTNAGNRIRAAVGPTGDAAAVLQEVYDIAIRSRTAITDVAAAYSRVAISAGELGLTQREVLLLTETVSKALQVGGASAGEAAATVTQLTQALGSGVLQGDELRSIRENSIVLAQAIAAEFETTVGGLKKLGEEGKLTSERVAQAILSANAAVEQSYSTLNVTIEQAFVNVGNAFTRYIGQTDAGLSASQRLTQALGALSDNFETVADVTLKVAGIIAAAFLGRAIGGMLAQVPLAVGAIGALITAMRVGTGVAVGFAASLGPITAIALAVGAAIYLLSDSHDDAAAAASAHSATMAGLEGALYAARAASGGLIDALVAEADAHYAAAEAAIAHARASAQAQAEELYFKEQFGQAGVLVPLEPANTAARIRESMAPVYAELDAAEARFKEATGTRRQIQIATSFADAFAAPITMTMDPIDAPVTDSGGGGGGRGRGGGGGGASAVNELADAYSDLTPEIDAAEEAQAAFNDRMAETQQVAGDALKGFIDDLIQGKSLAEALGGVLQKLGSKLIDSGIDALMGSLFSPAGGGGIAAGIRSIFGGGRASGGPVSSGKVYKVGERGPELFAPRTAGVVVPNNKLGGGSQHVTVSLNVAANDYFDARVGQISAGTANVVVNKSMKNQREMQRRKG